MKWAHQGILHVRSMEQSKGVYECKGESAWAHASRALIYLQDPEDQKVARGAWKLHFVSKVQDWFAHTRWTPNLGPRCSSGHNHWWRDLQHVDRKCPFLSISYFSFLPNKTPRLAAFRKASWRLFLPSFLRPHSLFLFCNPVNFPAHIVHINWQATRITNVVTGENNAYWFGFTVLISSGMDGYRLICSSADGNNI